MSKWATGIDAPVVFWISLLHLGALAVPFVFSWQGLVAFFFLSWLTAGIGICMGYHRLFTHASFKTYAPIRWLIAVCGTLAGEGSVIHWVANHRKHHVHSDLPGDPHSPYDGAWWSHLLWFTPAISNEDYRAHHHRWAPDLMKDPVMRFLDRTFLLWHFATGLVLFAIGYFCWDSYVAWSMVVYGLFFRLLFVLHTTWFVNSASHIWGYRNYETSDNSRNLWWVALLTYGEGWHNNHHADQRMANYGHRWWEFDITYQTICLMEKLGLAWNVVHKPTGAGAKSAREVPAGN